MIFPYIINAALVLAACVAFYKVLLRRETFYKVNRWLLIVCLGISFALPLLQVPQEYSFRKKSVGNPQPAADNRPLAVSKKEGAVGTIQAKNNTQQTIINTQHSTQVRSSDAAAGTPMTIIDPVILHDTDTMGGMTFSFDKLFSWIFILYWFGVVVFGANFLFQIILLFYRSWRNPVITDGIYRIVEVSGDKAPCSFGNTIFINPSKYDWETFNQILLHEKIHIRQRHTVDIIIAELVLIFQWFNPFAWIYRKEIESNLEFLTDDQVVQYNKVDKKSYQLSLLKVTAPHLPLRVTNNYNQSILKTRIAMMNKKRSNLHTAWKYFFLLPVLAILAASLNEPLTASAKQIDVRNQNNEDAKKNANDVNANGAIGGNTNDTKENRRNRQDIPTEGSWFAQIKGDKISIQFKSDDDKDNEHHFNGNTYKLTDFTPTPKEGVTAFKMTRDAGTMELTGKFEGNNGMGHYKFVADKAYADYMSSELKEKLDDEDLMTFFFVDAKKTYLSSLKGEGYTGITKEELIPLAALDVSLPYIRSIKNAGFKEVTLEDLIPLKSLGVDEKYISEIRSAGYKNITTEQLVSFKAQGIDKEYIAKVKQLRSNGNNKGDDDDAEDIVSFKAMNIDDAFINSFKAVGLTNIPNEQLVSMKAVGVTPEYVKSWHAMGFKDIDPEEFVGMKSQDVTPAYMKSFTDLGYKTVKPENLVSFKALGVTPEYIKGWHALGFKDIDLEEFTGMKAQNVTPEYMKSFTDMGYKNVKPENLVAFRALDITPDYIKSFESIGYKNIDLDELSGLKSQNVTPEFIKSFEALGFKNISIDEFISVKAVGVTPEYIKDMRAKGFNYDRLEKYVRLKSID